MAFNQAPKTPAVRRLIAVAAVVSIEIVGITSLADHLATHVRVPPSGA